MAGTGTSGPSTKASSQPCSSPEDTSDGRLGFEHDDSEEEYPRGISSRDIPDRTDIDCFVSKPDHHYIIVFIASDVSNTAECATCGGLFSVAVFVESLGPPYCAGRREREEHGEQQQQQQTCAISVPFGHCSK